MNREKKNLIKAFLIFFCLGLGMGIFLGFKIDKGLLGKEGLLSGLDKKTVNILFLGIDARDTETNSRSDTMMMASIDKENKRIAVISIPRDTHIKTPTGESRKINEVNYVEGPETACKVVGELLNCPVDYYVVTNFAGFRNIVDTLGGVHIDVENDMYHSDPVNPELQIDISKGYQYMDGSTALNYVRYRGGPTADIGRTQRQQKFLKAMADEMLKPKAILKYPRLMAELNNSVDTNLSAINLAYLACMSRKVDPAHIAAQTLPGYPYTDNVSGISYWEIDREKASTMIENLFAGKSFEVFEAISYNDI